jgi:hypothetical protein
MLPIPRLLLLGLLLPCLPSFAEPVAGLYEVREPVASQQPADREQALQRALDTLVLRLSGDPAALNNPALAELRKDPQQLISKYGYEDQTLLVDFDPQSSERSLSRAGLSLWGANRPSILAWWLNESAEGSGLVGDGQDSAAPLRAAAQRAGLPLRLPLADLEEQLLATAENLRGSSPDALRGASARYSADALLAVDAREDGGKWSAQWKLWLGDSGEQGAAEGADPAALAEAVLWAVNQRLAPRFVARPGAARALSLRIEGADLARYAELDRLLEPFAARLRSVSGDHLDYQLNASPEQLRAQLALGGLRELPAEAPAPPPQGMPIDSAQPPASAEPVLRFGW